MKKLIGDKAFYKAVLVILIPIVLQNFVTNFVNLLDNMMVGQLGTLQFSAVSIVNQLVGIFNLVTFGSMAAVGIFSAQYAGNKDDRGIKQCLNLKVLMCFAIFITGTLVFLSNGSRLISLYLNENTNTAENIAVTLGAAQQYMKLVLIGLLPFVLVQALTSTLRETGDTFLPMVSSIVAVLVNFVFNYLLIFGHLGLPRLGVRGAAIATDLSRFAELGVILIACYKKKESHKFLFADIPLMQVPGGLIKKVALQGSPLIFNEFMFSLSIAFINQCYSTRGLDAVAAINMTTTITHLFMIINHGMGHAISIMVGQALGSGDHDRAIDMDFKLIFLSVTACTMIGLCMFMVAPAIPEIYNTGAEVKQLACSLLRISALTMPVQAMYMASYFTLRCGGKTVLTLLFDSGYICLISFPVAFILSHFTKLPIFYIYLLVTLCDVPKALTGMYLVRKGIWANTII